MKLAAVLFGITLTILVGSLIGSRTRPNFSFITSGTQVTELGDSEHWRERANKLRKETDEADRLAIEAAKREPTVSVTVNVLRQEDCFEATQRALAGRGGMTTCYWSK